MKQDKAGGGGQSNLLQYLSSVGKPKFRTRAVADRQENMKESKAGGEGRNKAVGTSSRGMQIEEDEHEDGEGGDSCSLLS